jgi:hypothetical protein
VVIHFHALKYACEAYREDTESMACWILGLDDKLARRLVPDLGQEMDGPRLAGYL